MGPEIMHVDRNRMILRLVARGLIIMLFAMVTSVAVVAWISADLPPSLYCRSVYAAILIPMLISPPISFFVGLLNYRYYLLHSKVEWLAGHDELTGLLNRRSFRAAAEQMRAGNEKGVAQPVLLVLADIDHFKQVNDHRGHDAGDAAIRHVARILMNIVPEGAVVARVGGEEFAILTRWTSLAEARALADSICKSIEGLPCVYQDAPISLTVSLGVALGNHREDIGCILQRADQQLYMAKDMGRNAYSIGSPVAA